MKTSELTGALLDYWVATAEGFIGHINKDGFFRESPEGRQGEYWPYCPSSDWEDGGPIIEREQITIDWNDGCFAGGTQWGETALIAAMRAYVASKYGGEVPD